MALAQRFGQAKFVVQDINVAGLDMGRELAAKDVRLLNRITFAKHDFFQPQPVHADVYFFRHILHDWNDGNCIKIIKALLPVMKDGVKVLLNEGVLPEPPSTRSALLDDKQVLSVL